MAAKSNIDPDVSTRAGWTLRDSSIVTLTTVVLLLGIFVAQNFLEMQRESCTSDEVVHLPAGYTYLLKRDFRLNPEHPPLAKVLCAFPLLFLHPHVDFSDPNWAKPPQQYPFGMRFLYSSDADLLLFWGRLPMVLVGVLLGLFIYRWANQLYGTSAGLFALTLFSFSPNFLAHSHLVTTDVGVSAFLTMAFYFLWRHTCLQERRSLYWSGVFAGAALATKFSSVVLFPYAAFLLWAFHPPEKIPGSEVVRVRNRDRGDVRNKDRSVRKRKSTLPGDGSWSSLSTLSTSRVKVLLIFVALAFLVVQLSYIGSIDPRLYFKGLEQVNKNHNPNYAGYLRGDFRVGGWWYYFLVAFLVKVTSPFIILVCLRIILFLKNWRLEWKAALFHLIPALLLFSATSALADPLGVRYLLPVLALLMVFSSGVVSRFAGKKVMLSVLWIFLGWHVVSSALSFPHHLSYFNEFVGGPSHGMEWLDDSNVDWGQELKTLKKIMDERGISQVTLLSFSQFDNPDYYGIHCLRPKLIGRITITPGYWAVSAHVIVRMRRDGFDWVRHFPVAANLGYSMFVFKVPS